MRTARSDKLHATAASSDVREDAGASRTLPKLNDRIRVIAVSSQHYLFVYGTLKRGSRNRHAERLARSAEFLGIARVRGRLCRLRHYPGIRLQPIVNKWVSGEVFSLHDPSGLLRELDRYEGREFRRVKAPALFPNGSRLPCWIYEYVGPEER